MRARMSSWLIVLAAGCAFEADMRHSPPLCSQAWCRSIEARVATSDGRGHGPGIGANEWKSVIDSKLGVARRSAVPAHDSDAWCGYVAERVDARTAAGK